MRLSLTMMLIVLLPTLCLAGGAWQPMETKDQARQRHNAERYETYQRQQQRSLGPIGGYGERLGDTAPYGTERPGYRHRKKERSYNGW